jgi:hypothetical protein
MEVLEVKLYAFSTWAMNVGGRVSEHFNPEIPRYPDTQWVSGFMDGFGVAKIFGPKRDEGK